MNTIHRFIAISSPSSVGIHTSSFLQDKYLNANRQIKILGKLFGERKSGSKRRWYPNESAASLPTDITKTKKPGKNSSRRVSVLSKLFMRHITDLLATGEVSEEIIGKGLEISKVKVNPDFHGINVFWIAKGDENDDKIEEVLKRCSGTLRHELSQLRLMGEVPKITFVKDKVYANIAEVQNILKKCDFGDDHVESRDNSIFYDFAGYAKNERSENNEEDDEEPLPAMRQDVFGLDHKRIMDKILTKMKKSKQAWEKHEYKMNCADLEAPLDDSPTLSSTLDVQRQLEECKSIEFKKILKQRKIAKSSLVQSEGYELYEQYTEEDYDDDSNHWRDKDEGDFIEDDEKQK